MRYPLVVLAVYGMVVLVGSSPRAADWPEGRGHGRLGVWTDTGIVDELPERLQPIWKVPIHGGYAGPAVAEGRVFVTDAERADPNSTAVTERVLALDERTGDILWSYQWETNYAGLQLAYAICLLYTSPSPRD